MLHFQMSYHLSPTSLLASVYGFNNSSKLKCLLQMTQNQLWWILLFSGHFY